MVSVIIPTYNHLQSLLDCLRALAVQEGDPDSFEVIVVDTGSNDGTRERLQEFHHQYALTVLTLGHGGAGYAGNWRVDSAVGEVEACRLELGFRMLYRRR